MTEGKDRRRLLHGRRQGRPLRASQKQLLDQEFDRLTIALPASPGTLDPTALFTPKRQEIWLEIGFGGGEHLAWQIQNNPTVGLLGAEIFLNGIAKALAALAPTERERLRLHCADARDLLEALAPASLTRVFILFPDPWPKSRHQKRRIIQPDNVAELARVLKPGGELRLATDVADYAAWMLACLDREPAFRWTATSADDWRRRPGDWPATRYEDKGREAGRPPTFLRWLRL
ncbi:MAG: tRNA (guanosine(46)-N7)-methyltransferase TrmB [Pseudomonadota bacterium]